MITVLAISLAAGWILLVGAVALTAIWSGTPTRRRDARRVLELLVRRR